MQDPGGPGDQHLAVRRLPGHTDNLDMNVDNIETPDEMDSLEFLGNDNELEWEDDTPVAPGKNMPGDSADLFGDGLAEDSGAANGRLWLTVIIGEQEHRIDLHMIQLHMKVVTHGDNMVIGPARSQQVLEEGLQNSLRGQKKQEEKVEKPERNLAQPQPFP